MIAELRAAKLLMIGFADAPPAEQAVKAEELSNRIEAPPLNAPAVCLLDSGIASGHPLIRPALREEDAQAVVPEWGAADNDYYHGHGTTMAGIGPYGDLQEVLASEGPILLTHRLESVKILPNEGANDPELYGSITQEGVARAEVVAPDRKRAVWRSPPMGAMVACHRHGRARSIRWPPAERWSANRSWSACLLGIFGIRFSIALSRTRSLETAAASKIPLRPGMRLRLGR